METLLTTQAALEYSTCTIIAAITGTIAFYFFFKSRWKVVNKNASDANNRLHTDLAFFKNKVDELESLASVTRFTPSGVIIADENGEITYINSGFSKMTGYTLEKLKKNRGRTIMEASCSPNIIEIINEALHYKKSITYETHTFTKYCKKIWLSSTLTPVFDKKGNLKKFVIVDTDITPYKTTKDLSEDPLFQRYYTNVRSEAKPIRVD